MTKKGKKGPSVTAKAEDRHWHGKRVKARNAKNASRTGTKTFGPRKSGAGPQGARQGAPAAAGRPAPGARRLDAPELVHGRNPVLEALREGVPGTTLYYIADSDERVREALQLAADKNIPLIECGKPELDRLTDRAVHQGLALQVKPYRYAHPDDLLRGTAPLIVALDGITDARNLGAIVRSAAAFGASGILLPERRSAGVNAGAWKTSAGTLASTPVARCTNLTRQLKTYQEAGCFVAGLDAHGGTSVANLPAADGPFVLVVGSEGKGLGRLVTDSCDLTVHIPMFGHAESLNAGVAAGIALYEIARQRHTPIS
ncbi:23S rRNA (guanosine(2251)-2'-O)-methyltransferase RlmB [Actinocorallia sp. API 0066]|uniref:23S rRNA (guanosine(2251)-2'-O)-methyltransferase RlmB n=1 Tax=Actinocorallia sp. API 0066 TaxID=2896846 RepID=UPI001E44072B|nr:23S rRNA (guanosine(2251)-2'-O)-methyltransferase RlmB [Actinocorallia sp. API 0066]MCD0450234.1 23S rRNA (guanosine(2251)-2'-O)-methyltransferase RlmB [Actinocorallia sp. API 0066]